MFCTLMATLDLNNSQIILSMQFKKSILLSASASLILSVNTVFGGAVVAGFDANSLAGNDDGSTGFVNFGLGNLNFFGVTYSGAFLNNNGNMTFGSADGTFTPSALTGTGQLARIAPFFADVDTRNGQLMKYGSGTFGGNSAFGQTWRNVGRYDQNQSQLNTFQTLLVSRSDVGANDFDIIFNYDSILWDRGSVSPVSAVAGYTNGDGDFFNLTGSGVTGAFLNGGANALSTNSLNSNVAGRYVFTVRNGVVSSNVPDNGSMLALLGLALTALVIAKRKLG